WTSMSAACGQADSTGRVRAQGGSMQRWLSLLPGLACLGLANVAWSDSPGPVQNSWQAYPPSCLAYPLPGPSGPTWSTRATLETASTVHVDEDVNFIFWRTPCSGGKSALLGRMYRDAARVNASPPPIFDGLIVSQGNVQNHDARIATEPNTVLSSVPMGLILWDSVLFVFEN